MLFDHLHQFLSALIQRADAGYIAILSDGDKAQLRVMRFGEALETVKDTLDSRNFYAVNPSFDR